MRIASNCTLLAAALSATYRTYTDPSSSTSSSLENFLDNNGILLTMCMRHRGFVPWMECSRAKNSRQISASWVQANMTDGFRVIGPPIDLGPPVGLVLKPTAAKIRCHYPVDAGTDFRDHDGCGPNKYDPKYGSQGYDHAKWYRKVWTRYQIQNYMDSIYGRNTSWDSIPCTNFFNATDNDNALKNVTPAFGMKFSVAGVLSEDDKEWIFKTPAQVYIEQWSKIMGRPVCNQSEPAPGPSHFNESLLVYTGPTFWNSTLDDWSTALDLMDQTLHAEPKMDTWNELVLAVPPPTDAAGEKALVQAVFYIHEGQSLVVDEMARLVAKQEAKRRNKALLMVDMQQLEKDDDGDLFQCAEGEDDDEGGDDETERISLLRKRLLVE